MDHTLLTPNEKDKIPDIDQRRIGDGKTHQ